MRNAIALIAFSLLFISCKEETVVPNLDFVNTEIFVEGTIRTSSESRPINIKRRPPGSFLPDPRGYSIGMKGFTRDGMASLGAYMGRIAPGFNQTNRDCFTIEPLVWRTGNQVSEYTRIALTPTFFLEFPGLESQDELCRVDSLDGFEHLQLGEYSLGQEPGQAHIHLYAHGFLQTGVVEFADFYLHPASENEGLTLTITELDYESAKYTLFSGVYVSFEVPLAKGFNSFTDTEYEIVDLKGRLFFPLI